MALIKNAATVANIVIAHDIVNEIMNWKGKSIGELDQVEPWTNIRLAEKEHEGTVYHNLVLDYKDRSIVFPFSKEMDVKELSKEGVLPSLRVFIANRKGENDVEGEYENYTGKPYVSIGKAGMLDLGVTKSLVQPEMVKQP